MKITFEEDGAKLILDLPNTNPRARTKALRDFGCHPLDAEVEIIEDAQDDIETIIMSRVKVDKDGNKAALTRMICLFLTQIDPGQPVDFWDILYKMQQK